MNKSICVIVLLFLFSFTTIHAQLGVRGGVNVSSVSIDSNGGLEFDKINNRMGYHVGLSYTAPITTALKFRTGALFSSQGFRRKLGSDEFKSNFNYFEVPLSLVFNFSQLANTVFISFGPSFAVLLSADEDGNDLKDNIKSTNLGFAAGAGYKFNRFSLGANYNLGFTNLNNTDNDSSIRSKNINVYGIFDF